MQSNLEARRRFQEGFECFKRGDYVRAWLGYEERLEAFGRTKPAFHRAWQGESLRDKSILVVREQGLGDEIHLASCVPDLVRAARHCVVLTDERLKALFARSFEQARIVGSQSPEDDDRVVADVETDFQVLAGSVPQRFRRKVADFPVHKGYLSARSDLRQAWDERLRHVGDGLRVGIAWQGGRDLTDLRQPSLDGIQRILETPGVAFINLQYGPGSASLVSLAREEWGVEIFDWMESDRWTDIDDLAAEITSLDVVLTVTNTVAHLSGALGIPTWVIYTREWGAWWIRDDGVVPWYPSARVFSRSGSESWVDLSSRISEQLIAANSRRLEGRCRDRIGVNGLGDSRS